jgi:putative DeoR family transcriptional regulator (stage III sporulation protein D)
MRKDIETRCVKHGLLFIQRDETIRTVALRTGWSRMTVFKDLTERLYEVNRDLSDKVREKLDENKELRHLKGGYATQEKYIKIKERKARKNV